MSEGKLAIVIAGQLGALMHYMPLVSATFSNLSRRVISLNNLQVCKLCLSKLYLEFAFSSIAGGSRGKITRRDHLGKTVCLCVVMVVVAFIHSLSSSQFTCFMMVHLTSQVCCLT